MFTETTIASKPAFGKKAIAAKALKNAKGGFTPGKKGVNPFAKKAAAGALKKGCKK